MVFVLPFVSLTRNKNILIRNLEIQQNPFLPERDYVTFGSSLSQIRLSSVTFMRPTQGVENFGNISSLFCTLAILRPACKILWRSSQGNPSIEARKRDSKTERCNVRVSPEFLVGLLQYSADKPTNNDFYRNLNQQ